MNDHVGRVDMVPNIEEPHKFQREVIEIGRTLVQSTGQPFAVDRYV
jgi:hypothetical protein